MKHHELIGPFHQTRKIQKNTLFDIHVPVIFELMKDRDESESDLFTRVFVKAYYLRQNEHPFIFRKLYIFL